MDQRGRRQIDPGRVHVIEASAAPADPAERQRRVREIALALGRAVEDPKFRLPLLPETAAEALQLANDPSTPMNRLERVVSRDTALAARMLTVATSPAYAGTPLSGMGAARRGGRFNRPGQEALYLALDEATALAEYKQDNPWLPPGTICTFFVQGLRVTDAPTIPVAAAKIVATNITAR